jgi:hypothetical protein
MSAEFGGKKMMEACGSSIASEPMIGEGLTLGKLPNLTL